VKLKYVVAAFGADTFSWNVVAVMLLTHHCTPEANWLSQVIATVFGASERLCVIVTEVAFAGKESWPPKRETSRNCPRR
jgi:hypothetical protein